MSLWTVLLANIRLAAVQIATQGHPATTRSESIDYVVTSAPELPLDGLYSEKVLTFEAPALFEPHASLPNPLPSRNREDDGTVHIAVNSKVMKLSYRLIEICKRLTREATRPVKFHFFPGEQGVYLDGVKAQVQAQLPTASVYGYLEYSVFLQHLANCDLAMAAFPFGNTNSTVDCCLLGIPCVAHFGPEIPAQFDKEVLKSAGYPTSLACESDEAYFLMSLRLINDPNFRTSLMANYEAGEVQKNIFAPGHVGAEQFAQLFIDAYQKASD